MGVQSQSCGGGAGFRKVRVNAVVFVASIFVCMFVLGVAPGPSGARVRP